MNIWILNHYAHPPDMPGSTRHYDFARELIKQGHQVTIFTSSFSHLTRREEGLKRGMNYRRENVNGVEFLWLRTSPYYGGNDWNRAVNMLSYAFRVVPLGMRVKERPDVILASSPHPFAGLAGWLLAKFKNAPFIFEIRDLWPQVFVDIAGYSNKSLLVILLSRVEKFLCHQAKKIITLQPHATNYFKRWNIPEIKLVYIPIGLDPSSFSRATGELPTELGENISRLKSHGKVLVGYIGALEIHDSLDTILETAKLLQNKGTDRVHFILIGSGADKSRVMANASSSQLHNISFFQPVNKNVVPRLLGQFDIAIMCRHKTDLYSKYGVKTHKLWDYMMAAKPVVWAIDSANDPVSEAGCGITVPPEDAEAMAKAIMKLCDISAKERQEMGMQGHEYVMKYHAVPILAEKLLAVMKETMQR